jgi:hypothetical protein
MSAALKLDPVSAAVPVEGWLVLAMEGLRLALPQSEALQIELASDLKVTDAEGQEAGRLSRRNGKPWPAYCLDWALRVQRPAPAERRLCVFFGTQDDARGILCDRVWPLAADADLRPEPPRGCMNGPRSPTIGLARFQDGVALVTSAAELRAYLDFLAEEDHGRRRD